MEVVPGTTVAATEPSVEQISTRSTASTPAHGENQVEPRRLSLLRLCPWRQPEVTRGNSAWVENEVASTVSAIMRFDSIGGTRLMYLPIIQAAGTLSFVMVCYWLAVFGRHARWILPMISDCMQKQPESYLGAWGMEVFVCLGLMVNVVFMDVYVSRFPAKSSAETNLRVVALYTGVASCFGFGIVSIVTERDDLVLHSTGALFGFLSYFLYAILITVALLWRRTDGAVKKTSLCCKVVCNIIGLFFVIALISLVACGELDDGEAGDMKLALCEWSSVVSMALFNLSFSLDFGSRLTISDVWPLLAKDSWTQEVYISGRQRLLPPEEVL